MGQLTIPASAVVYADTSIFIYTIEVNPDYYGLLQPLWAMVQAKQVEIVSSELTLMEALVVPLRDANTGLVSTYEQFLQSSDIQLVPIDQAVLRGAARLRATTNLKTPDAVHAATALSGGCTIFLTNDSQFRTVPGLSPIVLREVLAA
ncbi:PIN domain-containing protein [Phormidesmis priestleyi ULC007]|uniref:Ribonuclease VapC n=1 Tax=Phormidesmis priestleyi ULC007 TaxID=1920490 RepID=A0A2T1DJG3_9CYAN|nr:PIN domain-containing protein [Phormidesmis priestleyi]PSB20637.1 PIN domain-containing protein [Phormidesmis priestleyi ULC007]PZO54307.1 MAG: PIN domain-containing protein [Phormidesmis priestleyi]